jgi:hypothetical protein
MRCTGSKTDAKGSYKPVQIPRFPLVLVKYFYIKKKSMQSLMWHAIKTIQVFSAT